MKQRWQKVATDSTMTVHERTEKITTKRMRQFQGEQLDWPQDTVVLQVPKDVRRVKLDVYLPEDVWRVVLYRMWKGGRCGAWNCRLLGCWMQ